VLTPFFFGVRSGRELAGEWLVPISFDLALLKIDAGDDLPVVRIGQLFRAPRQANGVTGHRFALLRS